jgi:glycosyltransferase involved in cell wall biosynthesis
MIGNWFAPMPPAPSGIAAHTAGLIPALEGAFDMRYWTEDRLATEKRRYPGLDTFTAVDDTSADINIYNIGNNHRLHARTWMLSCESPGITILHDTRLQNLFCGLLIDQMREPATFERIMRTYYGTAGTDACRAYFNKTIDIHELSSDFPLTEFALVNSTAVIAHTDDQRQRLSRMGIPYYRLELPHPSRPLPKRVQSNERLELFTFGYISSNRCLARVIEALGTCRDRVPFRFVIAGDVAPEIDIEEIIRRHRLTDRVELVGFLDDDSLDRYLQQSDLVFNLRNPTMGEASSAQLRIWDNAAVALVSDMGWYAEIPDDAAITVETGREARDVAQIVCQLHADRNAFDHIGPGGKQHLERWHSPDVYASGLATIAEQARLLDRPLAPFSLASRCADEVSRFLAKPEWSALFENAFDRIDELIPAPAEPGLDTLYPASQDAKGPQT